MGCLKEGGMVVGWSRVLMVVAGVDGIAVNGRGCLRAEGRSHRRFGGWLAQESMMSRQVGMDGSRSLRAHKPEVF